MKPIRKNQTILKNGNVNILAAFILSAFFLFPCESLILAQETDFSGEWILNDSKSDMGQGMFRVSKAISVRQKGNDLELEKIRTGRDGQEIKSTEKLTPDGNPTVNEQGTRTTKTTVTWSDDGKSITLVSNTTFSREGQTREMSSTEIWTLDNTGKTLTVKYSGSSPRGEQKATLVYDKK